MKSILEVFYMSGIDPDTIANEIRWDPNDMSDNTYAYYAGILMGLYLGHAITKKEQHAAKAALRTLRFGMILPN